MGEEGRAGEEDQTGIKNLYFITKQLRLAYSLEKGKHVLKFPDYMFK